MGYLAFGGFGKMIDTWITADNHFAHANIIKYTGRKAFMNDSEIQEYNEIMNVINESERENLLYNMKISKDSVNFMNYTMIKKWNSIVKPEDIIYHLGDFAYYSKIDAKHLVSKLNGYKVLILGNHDKSKEFKDKPIDFMKSLGFNEVYTCLHIDNFVLIHIPIKIRGVITLNVGVDVWNFYPIPFPITKQPMVFCGHVHEKWIYK